MVGSIGGGKLCHDHGTFTTAKDCQPGAVGAFTTNVPLAMAEQFSNTNYSAWANLCGGTYTIQDVSIDCYPLTGLSFEMRFTNKTGAVIPAGTVFVIAYAALGI
jgi:hypothetical protein